MGNFYYYHDLWFLLLVSIGLLPVANLSIRFLSYFILCLRPSKDLCRRYGSWAVVTGPTSGIGKAMAFELARRGLNLVLVGRDPVKLHDVSDAIKAGCTVHTKTVVFDLSLVSTAAGDEGILRLREAIDGLDVGVLVNNAGVAKPCAVLLHEAEVEAWVRMIRVNMWAVTEITGAVLPGMVERGRGAVVNIGSGSTVAIPSFPLYSVYAATKRYVAQFSRSLYIEYRSKGIDVQCQAPLYVETKMVSSAVKARRFSFFIPSSDAYARAAVRWIGYHPLCVPNFSHLLRCSFATLIPDFIHDKLRLRENLRQREIIQRLRSKTLFATSKN